MPTTRTRRSRTTPGAGRRSRTPFYSVLEDREAWELEELGAPSLAQEMGVLRVRVAQLLTADEPDWKETIRAIEVLVRLVRVQQGLATPETGAAEALKALGDEIERIFGGESE